MNNELEVTLDGTVLAAEFHCWSIYNKYQQQNQS